MGVLSKTGGAGGGGSVSSWGVPEGMMGILGNKSGGGRGGGVCAYKVLLELWSSMSC